MAAKNKIQFDSKSLHHIRYGWDDMAKLMLTEDLCEASDHWGTLLHYAAFYGNGAIINQLIDLGSDVNAVGVWRRTPIMVAIVRERLDVIKILLENDADINMVNADGVSALQMALDPQHFEPSIVRLFLDALNGDAFCYEDLGDRLMEANYSLYHAASLKDTNVMWLMLTRGMNINSGGYCGKTALHAAVELHDMDLASMILENGADANVLDQNGTSTLFIAASHGRTDMVKLLLENGADPNVEDLETDHTPLFAVYANSAAELKDRFIDCAELLLLHGAKPQNSLHDHHRLLDHALSHPSSANGMIRLLIAHLAYLELTGTQIANSVMRCNVEQHTQEYPMFQDYFKMCQKTLKMKVLGNWTVLDLMTASDRKLRTLARSWRLIPKIFDIFIEHNASDEFPYFFNLLWSRVSKAIKTAKLEDNAITSICRIFNATYDLCYVFAREVVSFLDDHFEPSIVRLFLDALNGDAFCYSNSYVESKIYSGLDVH